MKVKHFPRDCLEAHIPLCPLWECVMLRQWEHQANVENQLGIWQMSSLCQTPSTACYTESMPFHLCVCKIPSLSLVSLWVHTHFTTSNPANIYWTPTACRELYWIILPFYACFSHHINVIALLEIKTRVKRKCLSLASTVFKGTT